MDLTNAVEIVLELARQNVADTADMPHEHARQIHAIRMVEDLVVNQLGDD